MQRIFYGPMFLVLSKTRFFNRGRYEFPDVKLCLSFAALTCGKSSRGEIFVEMAAKYKECMNDMEGRKPGPTSILVRNKLQGPILLTWFNFNPSMDK